MRHLFLFYLLLPLQALAADDVDKEGHWFAVLMVGGFLLYTVVKKPEWFRKNLMRRVDKHEKYVAWIREQSEQSKSLSDDEVWGVIEQAVTLKIRVELALFFLLAFFIYEIYPLYAEPILGSNPPYWQEMLLGVAGGGVFAAIMALIGRISLRMRIRQLVDHSLNPAA